MRSERRAYLAVAAGGALGSVARHAVSIAAISLLGPLFPWGTLAVTTDPKEFARLLGEAGPILWGDMPTLPLYRQQRTLLTSTKISAVIGNPTRWGAGWNMDRWKLSR